MYEQLAAHYSATAPNGEKHSRIARYDLLLEFIEKQYEELPQFYCELLMYDVYLRENIKTRPAYFQNESSPELKNIYRHYKEKRKNVHIEKFHYDIRNYSEAVKKNDEGLIKKGPEKRENYVLFDYGIRDKINYEAGVCRIFPEDF